MIQGLIPEHEARQFNSLLSELLRDTKQSAPRIIRKAGVRFCQTNKNDAPKSKKRRKVVRNPNYLKRASRVEGHTSDDYYSDAITKKYRFQVFRTTGETWWEYTDERSAKNIEGAKIRHQGALKNTWASMIGDIMGKYPKLTGQGASTRGWRKAHGIDKDLDGANPAITLSNRIRYVFDVQPNAVSVGMQGAMKDMQKQLDRVRRNWKEKWR